MTAVLVVDDVAAMAQQYAYDLKRVGGYEPLVALNGREALDLLEREAVDCVILDLEMPGMDGFDVLRAMTRRGHRVPVIVYTGTGNYDRCAQAIRLGALSFIDKAEPMERVVQEVEHALERERLAGRVANLQARVDADASLIGASQAMQQLKDALGRVAKIPSPVLIVGESGSGKELVARELHRLGANPASPFVALNAGALPENLVEDELFGHERGAFTGAAALRKGAFEAAAAGTLFLDEIGELPLAAQAKLLRVLEQRQLSRLGGNRSIAVNARVVAATNRDLEAMVKAERFREDLLYRLNVHVLHVPQLRERRSDIPALVEHLVAATCARFGVHLKTVQPAALECLMAYDWARNNVRELRNIVERMIIATDDDTIVLEDVPSEIRDGANPRSAPGGAAPTTFQDLKAEAERQIIVAALERNDWHITRTAQALGLADHASLLKIMRRHNISRGRVEPDT
ncbi:MAG TPA: sigma-54 dependent transcriptional regulator [Gemmatimonadales bacterium]|nr:sigma-54 dependent transcriptional regulator [Gemmatimonadales bacterium]